MGIGRVVVTLLVVLADGARLLPGTPVIPLLIVAVMAVGWRWPVAGFLLAAVMTCLPGGAQVLLVWAAYRAGNNVASRTGAVLVAIGSVGCIAMQLVIGPAPSLVAAKFVVLVALPMVVGLYLAQHRRLVSALDEHNRQLRSEQELLAERERLRERLRIARDVHDSLGHRLSLVSIQAAALEVTTLPEEQHKAVRQLAGTARQAMDDLHTLVGTLRSPDEPGDGSPGLADLDELTAGFRQAGVPVTLRQLGEPRSLSASAGQAAYRVVEEGLTNAAKHAPAEPVVASLEWEPDALLLTVANDLPDQPVRPGPEDPGHGLTGLTERVRQAGGLLRTARSTAQFQLIAMLPLTMPPTEKSRPAQAERARKLAVGFAAAALICLAFPMVGFR